MTYKHLNDHTEEEMLSIIAVTDDHATLELYLNTERGRCYDFKPRPAVLDAILKKLATVQRPVDEGHLNTMRRIFDSYGDADPQRAAKFKAAESGVVEAGIGAIKQIQANAEKRQKIFEDLTKE